MIPCILTEQNLPVQTSGGYTLISIEITSPPSKTEYLSGQTFDRTGLVVEGSYGINGVILKTVDVSDNATITPEIMTDDVTRVKVSMWTADGKEITAYYPVIVHKEPRRLELTAEEKDKVYYYGDYYGPKINVFYSDNSVKETYSKILENPFATVGSNKVEISYSEKMFDGSIITLYRAVTVVVQPKPISRPTWKSNLTYTGNQVNVGSADYWNNWIDGAYTVSGTTGLQAASYTAVFTPTVNYQWDDMTSAPYSASWTIDKAVITVVPTQSSSLTYNGNTQTPTWNNYDSTKLTISGTTSYAGAGTYTAIFTPTSNYKWSDGSVSKSATWTIGKASRTITLNPTSVSLSASSKTKSIVATVAGPTDGNWGLSPSSIAGLSTYSVNESGIVTIIGDGSTPINSTTVTVSLKDSLGNCNDASATFTLSTSYWDFGAGNGEVADATWFEGLKTYLASNSGSSLKTTSGGSILGTTKTITLTSAVLGTTSHLIRVIGVDEDGPNTVTWQTANCLAQATLWSTTGSSDSNATVACWIDSACKAKAECLNYYKALPGYSGGVVPYIKTVKKGTCDSTSDSRAGIPTYRDETVFLPSELELGLDGYSPLSKANSTASNAENTQGLEPKGYSYYTSDGVRVKKLGDSGSNVVYWERSRFYSSDSSTVVCAVSSGGGAKWSTQSITRGLAPAFVVGN